jgi:nanoRNase/pAp phosphatase (c-di-AMP/oligoRNAs hydrolase)
MYNEHAAAAQTQLLARSTVRGNAVVLDLREDELIHPTNRFMVYALHPECNISIHVLWGLKRQNTVFAMGKSITNRSSRTHVGALMLSYGGGGHDAAGTCQVANHEASRVLAELLERVTADG